MGRHDAQTMSYGGKILPYQHAFDDLTSAVGTLAAAVSGHRHAVVEFRVHASEPGVVTFLSGTTPISEGFQVGSFGGHSPGFCPGGHFVTALGEALVGTYTGTGTCGVGVVYVSPDE